MQRHDLEVRDITRAGRPLDARAAQGFKEEKADPGAHLVHGRQRLRAATGLQGSESPSLESWFH